MRNRKIKVFVFYSKTINEVNNNQLSPKFEFLEIDNDIEAYYKYIGCDTIDITMRRIGGKPYNIIVDDEGLFADDPVVTMLDPYDQSNVIVGNIIIVGPVNVNGDLTSITEDDVTHIIKHIGFGSRTARDEHGKEYKEMFSMILINTD